MAHFACKCENRAGLCATAIERDEGSEYERQDSNCAGHAGSGRTRLIASFEPDWIESFLDESHRNMSQPRTFSDVSVRPSCALLLVCVRLRASSCFESRVSQLDPAHWGQAPRARPTGPTSSSKPSATPAAPSPSSTPTRHSPPRLVGRRRRRDGWVGSCRGLRA